MLAGVFGHSYEVVLPVYADKILGGEIGTYSRLLLFAGIGGLTATMTVALLGSRMQPARLFVVASFTYGVGILVLSRITWFPGAALNIGLIGASHTVFEIMSVTLVQGLAADEFRGRVMSIYQFSWGATALGGLLMGGLAEIAGAPVALGLGGILVVSATMILSVFSLRRVLTMPSESLAKSFSQGR